MSDLYQTSKSNISEHITNIYKEGELDKDSTVRKFRTVHFEGDRPVERNINETPGRSHSLIFLSYTRVNR